LHGHHVADCDMVQLARGVVRGPGPWRAPVGVCGGRWSSFVGRRIRCVWLSIVVRRPRSFVALLSCGGGCRLKKASATSQPVTLASTLLKLTRMISRDDHVQILVSHFH
jgi:hypothetical protein